METETEAMENEMTPLNIWKGLQAELEHETKATGCCFKERNSLNFILANVSSDSGLHINRSGPELTLDHRTSRSDGWKEMGDCSEHRALLVRAGPP